MNRPWQTPGRRWQTPVFTLLLATAALTVQGCEAVTAPTVEPGNVTVQLNATVEHTDTAVSVNGLSTLRFPSNGQALWLDRFDRYEFGGFPELEYPQDERRSVAWRLMLTHERPSIERNDSVIFSFFDHGSAAIQDSAMLKLTDLPHVGGGRAVGFDDFVRYLLSTSVVVDWMTGGTLDFGTVSFHETLVSGGLLTLGTTGSEDADPLTATFSAEPFAQLVGMENGEPVDLEGGMPVISSDRSLALTFSRPLGPSGGAVILIPFKGGGARAFVQTREPTDRWIIPAGTLAEMVAESAADQVAYSLFVLDYVAQANVVRGTLADGTPFSLPFVQRGETTLRLYLRRAN